MTRNINKYLPGIITILLVMWTIIVTSMTLFTLVISHWHGPFRDMWEIYPFLQKIIAGSWSLSDLWEGYGYSHRLFLPKLLFIADHKFFDASNHLLIGASIICQLLICILFSDLLLRDNLISVKEKIVLISILVCLQFSGTLLFNFMHTFDVQWFLCCFFIVAAFYLMSAECNAIYLIIAGLLIAAASLCNFSGMAAWPIWLLLVFSRMKDIKLKILLGAFSIIFIAIYMSDLRGDSANQIAFAEILKSSFYILAAFPCEYLANPLVDKDFLPFGRAVAIIVVPALFVLAKYWWNFLFEKNEAQMNRLMFFLACIGLFGYGVAVITAIGRGYDPSHAHAMRYQNIVVLFWSAVILFAILQSRVYLMRSKYALRLPFVAAFIGLMWCQTISWNQNIWLGYQVNRAHLAMMMGYSDNVPMIAPTVSRSMIYVPGYSLEQEQTLYARARKGIYHGDMAQAWVDGISLSSLSQHCTELSWALSAYKGPYSQYTSFSVSGETIGISSAYLVGGNGKVLAIAIPESTGTLKNSLLGILGIYKPTLKGFMVSDQKPSVFVINKGSYFINCTSSFEALSRLPK